MERFFVDPAAIQKDSAVITGEDVGHIARVLRLAPGDEIALSDGRAREYRARIVQMDKQAVRAALIEEIPVRSEPAHRVTLYQSLPKAGKMELIIQKCVELGIYAVVPMLSERCVVRPDGDFEKKRVRYQRVAYEAAKQCGRGIVPEVRGLIGLPSFPAGVHELILHAYEEERGRTLKQALRARPAGEIALIVGPEGGFTPGEANLLQQKGAVSVSLGPRILRAETAGMAMLAMTLYELEG